LLQIETLNADTESEIINRS